MMTVRLSPQSIEALAIVISGGAHNETTQPIGIYRSGPAIERFMRGCNIDFRIGSNSRYPALVNCLLEINRNPEMAFQLIRIIENAAHPGSFTDVPEKLTDVINYLNNVIRFDGFELQHQGHVVRLIQAGYGTAVVQNFAQHVVTLDFDTVQRDLNRALQSAETDPEDAVTGACSTVESVCRSVIIELGLELPAKKDISGLYRAVANPLGLAPDRPDLPPEIVQDVRKVLSGLATTLEGIGSLRTHAGDAHGRERGYRRIDARIARLSIHAASTMALFIIETWQQKFPARPLPQH